MGNELLSSGRMKKSEKNWLIGLGAVVGLLVFAGRARGATGTGGGAVATLSYLGQSGLPRGMRNNNPGNIRISTNAWQGKVPAGQNTDGAFEQFSAYIWGIRAMIKNLISYQQQRGLSTLRQIISTWAPSTENDTNAYISRVSSATGIGPDQTLDLSNRGTMQKVVQAMSAVENGRPAVTPEQFAYAWSLV